MYLRLVRDNIADTDILGKLSIVYGNDAGKTWYTIEQPWVTDAGTYPSGKPFKSCIPAGLYLLKPTSTPNHPETFVLINERLGVYEFPDGNPLHRFTCLIHVGNFVEDVEGCIAIGTERADHPDRWVKHSKVAMNQFRESVREPVLLEITNL